jgi:sugar phosphate isomerase/epimerase
MQKFYVVSFLILSLFITGLSIAQDTPSIVGKEYDINGYEWIFKKDGVVSVKGPEAPNGTDGKFELEGNKVFAEVGLYQITGTFDGFNFEITGIQQSASAEAAASQTVNYEEVRIREFKIALQTYTYRKFSFMEALDKEEEFGVTHIQAYPGQKLNKDGSGTFDVNLSPEDRERVKNRLKKLGLTLDKFGVADVVDEASCKTLMQFAKDMGISTIVIEPSYDLLPMIDLMANEYKINVAVHNHPLPTPYWHAGITYFHIHNLSSRIGICGDTGHWTRSGVTPSQALNLFKGRIFDVHLKDLNEFGNKEATDVPFGSGKSNIRDILAELSLQNYHGTITIEHEKEADSMNPAPPIKEGLNYIKKITYYEGYQELLGSWEGRYHKHGWNHYGPGYFELDPETGVLTSSGGMGLMWYSVKMFDDFVLDVEYLCHAPNTNSGVFIRVPDDLINNDYIYKSFEIQIDDRDEPSKHSTGAVYDAEPPKMNVQNPTGEWNHFRITFRGDDIKVELNGQLINTWKAEPRGKIKSFAKKGYIGLQNHDSDAKVSFRNIFVKELK